MRHAIGLSMGVWLALVAPTPATAAAPLTTPPLLVSTGGGIFCEVANVGTTPVDVLAEVMRSDGVQDSSCNQTLNPGEALHCGGSVNVGFIYYCRFTGG